MEKYTLQITQEQVWEREVEASSPEEAKRILERGLLEGSYYPRENEGGYQTPEVEVLTHDTPNV